MMTEHATVMHRDMEKFDERAEVVVYTNDDGESDLVEDYQMDWDVYVRMGRPTTITLNVRAGDHLNVDEADVKEPADLVSGHQVGDVDV